MNEICFLRHAGWVGPEDFGDEPLNIIGCGAVGSHVAVLAAKMGWHHFNLWDPDKVESHNISNQTFDTDHIGQYKTLALKEVLERFNPHVVVTTHEEYFTSEKSENMYGPLIICTDTMRTRQDMYDVFYMNTQITHVFEARLGFDFGEVYVIDNTDPIQANLWKATLQPDAEVPEGPCNLKICTTLVWLISSALVHELCAKFAALRQQKPWNPKMRQGFGLGDKFRYLSS